MIILANDNAIQIFRRISFFEGLDDKTLEFIACSVKPIKYSKDMVLFHEGSEGNGMYVVLRGKVEIYRLDNGGYRTVLAQLTDSDILVKYPCLMICLDRLRPWH